jgi:hypothetical protein
LAAGLPDGLFSNQKIPIWVYFGGPGIETFGIFMTIWNILRPFGKVYGSLVLFRVIWYYFSRFDTLDRAKSGNPAWQTTYVRTQAATEWK